MKRRDPESTIENRTPTPPEVFSNRRTFLKLAAAAGALGLPACRRTATTAEVKPDPRLVPPGRWPTDFRIIRTTDDIPAVVGGELTPAKVAGSHNNFYEFLSGRGGDVWPYTAKFEVRPWTVTVSGECNRPQTLSLDELYAFEPEERLYHFRCVERWAMNVPWIGFPLETLLKKVEPSGAARFVRFVSANRPEQMPGMRASADRYPWPYHEALRLDEAMNELTMVVTGVYGQPLTKQHGAPIRIIAPWKYGYKNPKSIVAIELTSEQPPTFWSEAQPHEYGFLSNVNPNIPHPRWSQAQSYWLDSREAFATPIFNGYEKYVAALYPDEPRRPQEPLRSGEVAR